MKPGEYYYIVTFLYRHEGARIYSTQDGVITTEVEQTRQQVTERVYQVALEGVRIKFGHTLNDVTPVTQFLSIEPN